MPFAQLPSSWETGSLLIVRLHFAAVSSLSVMNRFLFRPQTKLQLVATPPRAVQSARPWGRAKPHRTDFENIDDESVSAVAS